MFCRNMVGMTFKHFKGGVYKVVGVHSMQHHWEGVPEGQGLVVVRYVRVQKADGSWDDSGEEYLRPFSDWEAQVVCPNTGKIVPRFRPIGMVDELEGNQYEHILGRFTVRV